MSRKEFTTGTKRAARKRSNDICECHLIPHVFDKPCGLPLGDGNIRYEHIDCDAISRDNSLENCAALTVRCWRYKTDHYDKPTIAKSNRVRDRAHNIKARRGRSLPGSRDSNIKITIMHGPVDRKTGEPVRRRGNG